ncbi:hypothetical protein ACFXCZ_27300 [Streptomyces sp. NPDC059396]|uniref:hypothetical protein n=1 Tax=Streptomyces sp. NPDC059396 TaxID=3346819 RepID=UPI00369938C4
MTVHRLTERWQRRETDPPMRQMWERYVHHAALAPAHMGAALVLASWADYTTGLIPASAPVAAAELAAQTGIVPGRIAIAYRNLATRCLTAGPAQMPTRLTLPAAVLPRLRTLR